MIEPIDQKKEGNSSPRTEIRKVRILSQLDGESVEGVMLDPGEIAPS